jgi:hypothetical protein
MKIWAPECEYSTIFGWIIRAMPIPVILSEQKKSDPGDHFQSVSMSYTNDLSSFEVKIL